MKVVYVHIEKLEYTEKNKDLNKNYMQHGEDHSSFRVRPCSLLNMYIFAFIILQIYAYLTK